MTREQLFAIRPTPITRFVLRVTINGHVSADYFAAKVRSFAIEKAREDFPHEYSSHSDSVDQTYRPTTIDPVSATNHKMKVCHRLRSVEGVYRKEDIHGFAVCGIHMVVDTFFADAEKYEKCKDCFK